MGQARNRKEEIDALKASLVTLHIKAVRHLRSGGSEMMAFGTECAKEPGINKNDLLGGICDNLWHKNQDTVAAMIAQYMLRTKSYELMNGKEWPVRPYGYEIHFYESGAQTDKPSNVYGCREVIGVYSKEQFHEMIDTSCKRAEENGDQVERF